MASRAGTHGDFLAGFEHDYGSEIDLYENPAWHDQYQEIMRGGDDTAAPGGAAEPGRVSGPEAPAR